MLLTVLGVKLPACIVLLVIFILEMAKLCAYLFKLMYLVFLNCCIKYSNLELQRGCIHIVNTQSHIVMDL